MDIISICFGIIIGTLIYSLTDMAFSVAEYFKKKSNKIDKK